MPKPKADRFSPRASSQVHSANGIGVNHSIKFEPCAAIVRPSDDATDLSKIAYLDPADHAFRRELHPFNECTSGREVADFDALLASRKTKCRNEEEAFPGVSSPLNLAHTAAADKVSLAIGPAGTATVFDHAEPTCGVEPLTHNGRSLRLRPLDMVRTIWRLASPICAIVLNGQSSILRSISAISDRVGFRSQQLHGFLHLDITQKIKAKPNAGPEVKISFSSDRIGAALSHLAQHPQVDSERISLV